MFYRLHLTIPRDTPETTPASHHFVLDPGIIHRLIVKFPPGCAEEAYLAVYLGGHQMWPTNIDDAFHGDGESIDFREHVPTLKGYHWYLLGWSPDTNFTHTVTVRIGVLPEWVLVPWKIWETLTGVFKRLLGLR